MNKNSGVACWINLDLFWGLIDVKTNNLYIVLKIYFNIYHFLNKFKLKKLKYLYYVFDIFFIISQVKIY